MHICLQQGAPEPRGSCHLCHQGPPSLPVQPSGLALLSLAVTPLYFICRYLASCYIFFFFFFYDDDEICNVANYKRRERRIYIYTYTYIHKVQASDMNSNIGQRPVETRRMDTLLLPRHATSPQSPPSSWLDATHMLLVAPN